MSAAGAREGLRVSEALGIRTVGFQGEMGAFSEEAVGLLCPGVRPVPRRTFVDVVRAVEDGEDDAGLLPVENTLAGGVAAAYDALRDGRVHVRAEVVLPIRLCLLGVAGAGLKTVREVASHPVALSQCGRFFAAHPHLEPVTVYDTAGAAAEVARLDDPSRAAVASRRAAERFGLRVLAADVQDRPDNQTRFYLMVAGRPDEWTGPGPSEVASSSEAVMPSEVASPSKVASPFEVASLSEAASPSKAATPSGAASPSRSARPYDTVHPFKTALVVEAANRPGSLHELLGVFARRSLDLTYIESRPARRPWTYRFILEYVHAETDATSDALEDVRRHAANVRVLGIFPAWRPGDHTPDPEHE